MIYLLLIHEFFKIGLFSFGGGYATIPFLYHISYQYGWFSIKELTHIIAIASITPGPVGINAATYAGLKTAGFFGALFATTSEIIPSFILILILASILKKYSENFYIKSVIETLKPISCALIVAVAVNLLRHEITDFKSITLLLLLFLLSIKSKRTPLYYITVSAIFGICLRFFGI